MSRRKHLAGFSLIEVMTAVVVMIVCSTGIAMMVNATTRANEDGWETTVATQFAATWMERVKRDAMRWTNLGNPVGTAYLDDITGEWFRPEATAEESYAADAFGRDTTNAAQTRFCVNLQNQAVHTLGGVTNAIRVNVRVYWDRSARGDVEVIDRATSPVAQGCNPLEESSPRIREIYVSTVVHRVVP